jgi:uncharacterized protein (TIGR00299 family) protein
MHLQLDPVGGIAGDMFAAAILDAWPELLEETLASVREAGLPEAWQVTLAEHGDDVLRGRRFLVTGPAAADPPAHRAFSQVVRELHRARLDPSVRDRALSLFELLAQAESEVHGTDLDSVIFHELGSWDSVTDIVAAAHLLDALRPTSWSLGPVPIGRGRIRVAHGSLPVPAPAVVRLLQGFEVIDDGIGGERVTPTGAAILRHLAAELGPPSRSHHRPMTLTKSGIGFGTRKIPGISNVLRIIAFDEKHAGRTDDIVGVIAFDLDDQTPEDLGIALENLRRRDDILDVLQVPAFGKKGRLLTQVQILCRRESVASVLDACFMETTTIGIRWSLTARARLQRRTCTTDLQGAQVAVKIVDRPRGIATAKAEADDVAGAGSHDARERIRRAASDAALAGHSKEGPCDRK